LPIAVVVTAIIEKETLLLTVIVPSKPERIVMVLKNIEIGNREHLNVYASIVNDVKNRLLLGLLALSKFGKISIDDKCNENNI
jgi:hypothetical protein